MKYFNKLFIHSASLNLYAYFFIQIGSDNYQNAIQIMTES